MKIAALVMAHRSPEQLSLLLKRLQTPLWTSYVHLDGKVDRALFSECEPLGTFVRERAVVHWGGYSQVQASLNMLREAVLDPECTHFYLMSGQCFPVKTDDVIVRTILERGADGDFVSADSMIEPNAPIPLWRLEHFAFNDHFPKHIARYIRATRLFMPKRAPVAKLLRGLVPYAGSSWWLLTRRTVERILKFIDSNPWYVSAFRFSHCPDECFYQTLVYHFGGTVSGEQPTAVFWDGRPNPLNIDAARLNEARNSWHLLARKFDFEAHPETRDVAFIGMGDEVRSATAGRAAH